MPSTKINQEIAKPSSVGVLHLPTRKADGKPVCGEPSPDAEIGSYCERLDGDQWIAEVIGKDREVGKPCAICLSLYNDALVRKRALIKHASEGGWPLFVMITKWHIALFIAPIALWALWHLCRWIASAPVPPRAL
jgi:hypothetical protein